MKFTPVSSKKLPLREVLILLSEEKIDHFTWLCDSHEEAVTLRNSVTSSVCRRQDGLKVATSIVRGIKEDQVLNLLIVERI